METNIPKVATAFAKLGASFSRFGGAVESLTQATENAKGTLDKIALPHKARWPIYPVRSRKKRLRRYRVWRRKIAERMHELQGDYIQAIVSGDKSVQVQITQESSAYLVEAVANFTVVRFFESRFSGESKHVLTALNHRLRKISRGHTPLKRQSGYTAIRYSFLARRDAERSRIDRLKSAAGAGFGVIV